MKTKQLIISTLILVAVTTQTAYSQVSAGIKHGVAMTTFAEKGNLYNNNEPTYSYTAGVFLDLPVKGSFGIQPELIYVRKGRTNESTELKTAINTDFLIHYLEIPVLFQYSNTTVLERAKSKFFINAGPYAAFAIDRQTRNTASENLVSLNVNDKDKTDWGTVFGIGFQTPVRGKDVRFDLKYDLGLTKISNQPDDYRTKSLSLTIGMLL